MEQQITNFSRFYAAFNRMPCSVDRDSLKRSMVLQFTWGRTSSLREMETGEYLALCESVERLTSVYVTRSALRHQRSTVLHLMQLYGVNTADWPTVDRFCQNPRLMGKRFCKLSTDELQRLEMKLRMMLKKKKEE